ncbi:hypothetical protein BJV74DRAFT_863589, partial [Russula compacta]
MLNRCSLVLLIINDSFLFGLVPCEPNTWISTKSWRSLSTYYRNRVVKHFFRCEIIDQSVSVIGCLRMCTEKFYLELVCCNLFRRSAQLQRTKVLDRHGFYLDLMLPGNSRESRRRVKLNLAL